MLIKHAVRYFVKFVIASICATHFDRQARSNVYFSALSQCECATLVQIKRMSLTLIHLKNIAISGIPI